MKRFLLILLLWPGLRAQQAADVLKMVRDAYANLKTVHMVATRTDAVTMAGGVAGEAVVEYELAEAPGGRYLARIKRADGESLAVSDGSTTWKALPKQKRWAKIEAAGMSDEEDAGVEAPAETAERPQDLHESAENMLIRHYLAIVKTAQGAEPGKEENVKVAVRRSAAGLFVLRRAGRCTNCGWTSSAGLSSRRARRHASSWATEWGRFRSPQN
jgi:hypothetical protein